MYTDMLRTFTDHLKVIIAFLIPAGFALLFVIFAYATGSIDHRQLCTFDCNVLFLLKPSLIHNAPNGKRYPLAPELYIHHLRARTTRVHVGHDACSSALLILRDLQLFTGLCMILIAFGMSSNITQYHFAIASDLTWIAGAVCDGTDCIINPKRIKNSVTKTTRFICTIGLQIFILASSSITWDENFIPSDNGTCYVFGRPLRCIWDNSEKFRLSKSLYVYLVIIAWSTIDTVLRYCPDVRGSDWVRNCLDIPIINILSRTIAKTPREGWGFLSAREIIKSNLSALRRDLRTDRVTCADWAISYAHCLANIVVLIAMLPIAALALFMTMVTMSIVELLISQLLSITRILMMFSYGALNIAWYRFWAADNGRVGEEDTMGFGQILPILLLFIPCVSIVDALWESHTDSVSK